MAPLGLFMRPRKRLGEMIVPSELPSIEEMAAAKGHAERELPMGQEPRLKTPRVESTPQPGLFAVAPRKRTWQDNLRGAGAVFSDISAGLRGQPTDHGERFRAGEQALNEQDQWEATIAGMELDPLEQMLAKKDPTGFATLRVKDVMDDKDWKRDREATLEDYGRERGDTIIDRDMGYKHTEKMEDMRANRPRIDNTGQAIVRTDPKTGKADVLYRDPQNPTAGRKTFRAATPQELKDRGYPAGTTGQIDSDGRLYPDKQAKPQSAFTQTEVKNFRSNADGLMVLGNAVDQYIRALEANGGPQLLDTPMNKNQVQAIKSAHGLITEAIKDAGNLGALDQGVQNLVNSIISDPVGLGTFGKSTASIKQSAKQLYDSIDYKLGRIPEQYRGGATGNTEMRWRSKYTPQQIEQAKYALANWDSLPENVRTPAMRAMAEHIAGAKPPVATPSDDEELTDDQYDAVFNNFDPVDLANPPEGVDPSLWDQLTDEEKAEFLGVDQ